MDIVIGVFRATLDQYSTWAEKATPKLLAAVLILLIGWLAAKLAQLMLTRLLRLARVNVLAERSGVDAFLRRGNVHQDAVSLLGRLVYWILLLLTILGSVDAMGISQSRAVFSDVISVIPHVVIAVVILLLGLSFASFVGEVVQTAAANASVRQARTLSNVTRWSITALASIVALDQLHIATAVLSQAFLIVLSAVSFGLALAFGLGCKDLAGRIAEAAWQKEQQARQELADSAGDAPRGGEHKA